MESLRTVSVTIEIDTNKQTIKESFESMSAAVDWWNAIGSQYTGEWYEEHETPEEFR